MYIYTYINIFINTGSQYIYIYICLYTHRHTECTLRLISSGLDPERLGGRVPK